MRIFVDVTSLRRPITLIALAALVSSQLPIASLVAAPISRADYEACQARDDAGLKAAISTIVADAITSGTKTIDYRALVAEQWRVRNLDQVIDSRVDIAVVEVTNETTWSERLKSLADTEKSQELATMVAERVYRSDAVKSAIEDLAVGVAKDVGRSIEFASSDATSSLLQCLQAFVGPRYGGAVAGALAGDASRDVRLDPNLGSGDVNARTMLQNSTGGLAGATILIVRRQLANLAQRVGQRIVGSILSRLVSVVAGGVGLVLIAKDLWDFRNGVLPIIATEMKAPATKEKVKDELATMLGTQMREHVKEIASAAADQVVAVWQTFRRAHALVLKIADDNGEFRKFLDGLDPQALPRLDEVVSILVSSEGEDAIVRRLQDGTLNAAVHQMPVQGLEIARDTQSITTALDWTSLAGDRLDKVLEYELHRRVAPKDLTKTSLDRILALGDRATVIKIANLPAAARDALFRLQTADLNALIRALSEDELRSLAGYLDGLRPLPRERVLKAVADSPAKMQVLSSRSVRERIIASHDQAAAADMMLAPSSGFSPGPFIDDARLVWDGRIEPLLIWDKHPKTLLVLGFFVLIVLFWLARLFRPRRGAGASDAGA